MAAIAVAVRGLGDKAAVLERRLVGVVADIPGIENAAADHEGRPALLGRLQQLPQVGHRAVVQIGRRRPDAVQHPRLVGGSGNGRRRIKQVAQPRIDEGSDFDHRLGLGLGGELRVEQRVEIFARQVCKVLAKRAKDAALRQLCRRRYRRDHGLGEQGSHHRIGKKVAGLRGIADPGANRRRRHQRAVQETGVGHARRIECHLRVRADGEDRGAPRAGHIDRRLHRVTAAAMGFEQRLAERCQRLVEAEKVARPRRRAQCRDLLFQRLQSVEFD